MATQLCIVQPYFSTDHTDTLCGILHDQKVIEAVTLRLRRRSLGERHKRPINDLGINER